LKTTTVRISFGSGTTGTTTSSKPSPAPGRAQRCRRRSSWYRGASIRDRARFNAW
jgi:hypothetical protein